MPRHDFGLWIALAIALSVAGFVFGFVLLWRSRRLRDVPISRVRSAAQGFIALEGRAVMMPGPETRSPLSGEPCIWWHGRVTRRKGGDREDMEVIFEDSSGDLFHLHDTTGACVVDPFGARVIPSLSRTWFGAHDMPRCPPKSRWDALFSLGGEYCYHERLIQPGQRVYAHGWFRSESAAAEYDEKRDVAALLAEWKQNRRELMGRFDRDRNGVIDAQEWEAARAQAIEEVRAQYLDRVTIPGVNVLAAPQSGGELLISALDKARLSGREQMLGALCLLGGVAAAAWCAELVKLAHSP